MDEELFCQSRDTVCISLCFAIPIFLEDVGIQILIDYSIF